MPLNDPNPALENRNGVALDVDPNAALPASSTGLLLLGKDDTNTVRTVRTYTDGTVRVDPSGLTHFPSNLYDANGRKIRSTAGQELRVAGLYTLADLTNKYELDSRLWDTLTATGGTVSHVAFQSALRATVTGVSGSSAAFCTNTYYKYQAGYTQLISFSIIHSSAGQTNQTREWGYFDSGDGFFWRLAGTTLSIVERSSTSGSPVDTVTAQSSWSVDKLDGTGVSGLVLDLTKGNLFEIEIQWFGVGTTRYYINGILCHEVEHSNTLTVPYAMTAQLPVHARIANSGASTGASITLVCARVAAQAQSHSPQEWVYSVFTPSDILVSTTVERPILTIRPKSTYNSIVNRMWVLPKYAHVSTEGYKISYKIVANATLTGDSFTSAAATSGVEYDVSATSYSGGELISHGFIGYGSDENDVVLEPYFSIFGRMLRIQGFAGSGSNTTVDSLSIVAINEAVGFTKARGHLTWAEVR